jgi:hypothetical protein
VRCDHTSDLSPKLNLEAVKAYLRRYGAAIRAAEDPIATLLDACGCITAEMATNWFRHSGYIW